MGTSVQATEVSFSGGFTSFRGTLATPTSGRYFSSVHTDINGVRVYADKALPGAQAGFDTFRLGWLKNFNLLDAGGDPIPTVDFSRILFNTPNPNVLGFKWSAPLDLQVGDLFKVGTFNFTNGSWFANSPSENVYPDTDFGFTVTTHSRDPALDGHTFTDTLRFHVTAPFDPNTPVEDDADYFSFVGNTALQTFRVLEAKDLQGNPTIGNTGTVDLMVKIGSLIPVALGNPTGAAFIGAQVSAVPEPSEGALVLAGLAVLLAARTSRVGIRRPTA